MTAVKQTDLVSATLCHSCNNELQFTCQLFGPRKTKQASGNKAAGLRILWSQLSDSN